MEQTSSQDGNPMQLGAPAGPGPMPDDIAASIRAGAGRLGHRPAITQLLPAGRQEQSGASLAQWTAKGAHFLEVDLGLEPGARVHLAAPMGWTTAAVALAVWWAGMTLTLSPHDDAEVAIVHTSNGSAPRPTAAGAEVLLLGDGIDGAPLGTAPLADAEAWVRAVQPFPDQPPPPRASADAPGLALAERTLTQAQLLELATRFGGDGTVGLDGPGDDPALDLALLCLRPLWCARPTLVSRGVPREAADGDRVSHWR